MMELNQQQQQNPITIEQATSEFQAGVTAALRSWSALRTAVQSGWGGVESNDKAEFLREYILESLDFKLPKPKVDIDDLEDHLAIYMEEEFSIVLEDESERQMAQLIWQLYQSCGKGNYDLSRQIVANSANAVTSNVNVNVQCENSDDESDDGMDASNDDSNLSSSNQYLFGVPNSVIQSSNNIIPSQPREPKPEPIVDDDGFTMVPKRR